MADRTWITVFFPTPLIFRYHLPLKHQEKLKFIFKKHIIAALKKIKKYLLLKIYYLLKYCNLHIYTIYELRAQRLLRRILTTVQYI
jgi:desulfoferrodoxin (superoxide reductase-like protein)